MLNPQWLKPSTALETSILGVLSSVNDAPGLGGGGWTPAQWFLASEQGIWLDQSDFTRYMGELGPELVPNSDFDNGEDGWVIAADPGDLVFEDGVVKTYANGTGTTHPGISRYIPTVPGKTYLLTVEADVVVKGTYPYQAAFHGQGAIPWVQTASVGRNTSTAACVATATSSLIAVSGISYNSTGQTNLLKISVRELTAISTATMFQDAAGTVPVTGAGQPVGRILDKSGRGNHATQATTANKPILQSIGGKLALVFDGVDDYVETGLFPAGTLGNNMDLFALIRLDAVPVDDAYFADFITGVKRYAFALGAIGLLTSQSIAGGFKVNGTTPPQLRQGVFDAMGVGNWCVLEINNIDLSNFVSFGLNNYQTHNSAASFAEVILAPAQSAEARTQAREYLAAKAGITL